MGMLSTWLAVAAPAAEARRPMETEDLFRLKRVSDPQISPDGRWVVYVVGEVLKTENRIDTDLWLVSTEGGESRRLTSSPKHDRHPRWSPDSRRIVFESNREGGFQLYTLPIDGGEARPLTTISTEATQPIWSPDGRWIAFVSVVYPEFSDKPYAESDALNRKRNEEREASAVKARLITRLLYRHWDSWVADKRQHLFMVPADGGEPRDVTPGDRDAVPTSSTFSAGDDFDFSPDGEELAYTATPLPQREEAWKTDYTVMVVNLKTGERRAIGSNPAADGFPRFSPDGRYIAYRAQSRAGFEADRWQLMVYDRAGGSIRSLTDRFDSSVESFAWAADSRSIVFEAEEKGTKPLWRVRLDGGEPEAVIRGGVNGELSLPRRGSRMAFTRQSLSRAAEVHVVNLDSGEIVTLTRVNGEHFARMSFVEPESVVYKGDRGVPVQMWIVKPPGFDPSRRYPLVFWVHGGPQGAFLDAWSTRWNAQLWAAQGYVLAMPNPRGSTGFGQAFVDGVTRDWGGKVIRDLMQGLAFMERQPYIDRSRMAAAGASFGGYVMNWFQGHTDKFRTLVTHCGVYNFHAMYGATDEIWFAEWEHGIPWERADFDRDSPHRFAGRFNTPNLVIHNELDFRVPLNDGLSLFTTLQRRGVPSKLLYFPDEGHWVLKPQNSELWHKTVFDWLKEYLAPTAPQ